VTKDVRTPRTPLKSLKVALRERLSPEQFSRIFVEKSDEKKRRPLTGRDLQFIALGVILSGLALVLVGVIGYLMGR